MKEASNRKPYTLFSRLLQEITIIYLFIKSDLLAVIVPGSLTLLASWIVSGAPLDQAGDQLIGRNTLPLAIGDKNARIILALFFLVFSPLIILLLFTTNIPIDRLMGNSILNTLFIMILLLNWFITFRILKFRTANDDHKSYTSFLYLFCLLMFLVGVIR